MPAVHLEPGGVIVRGIPIRSTSHVGTVPAVLDDVPGRPQQPECMMDGDDVGHGSAPIVGAPNLPLTGMGINQPPTRGR